MAIGKYILIARWQSNNDDRNVESGSISRKLVYQLRHQRLLLVGVDLAKRLLELHTCLTKVILDSTSAMCFTSQNIKQSYKVVF